MCASTDDWEPWFNRSDSDSCQRYSDDLLQSGNVSLSTWAIQRCRKRCYERFQVADDRQTYRIAVEAIDNTLRHRDNVQVNVCCPTADIVYNIDRYVRVDQITCVNATEFRGPELQHMTKVPHAAFWKVATLTFRKSGVCNIEPYLEPRHASRWQSGVGDEPSQWPNTSYSNRCCIHGQDYNCHPDTVNTVAEIGAYNRSTLSGDPYDCIEFEAVDGSLLQHPNGTRVVETNSGYPTTRFTSFVYYSTRDLQRTPLTLDTVSTPDFGTENARLFYTENGTCRRPLR